MRLSQKVLILTFKKNYHIVINIEDTGVGIPEDIQNRIFDPFFTTKGVQSTGLGMSISYGIINRHKGTILMDSREGKFMLLNLQPQVRKVFDIIKALDGMNVFKSQQEMDEYLTAMQDKVLKGED